METKYYKEGRIYYKVGAGNLEKAYAYHHCYGIEKSIQFWYPEDYDAIEITESQYNRVRKLILLKLS